SRRAPGYQHQPCQPAPGRPLRTLTDGSAGGFHLVVSPAEGVEVGDFGCAAGFGVGVVVFLDVVDLAGPGGGSGAAGDGADGEGQAEVFQHFGGGDVSVGGEGEECSGGGVGQDSVPGVFWAGERAGDLWGGGFDAVGEA